MEMGIEHAANTLSRSLQSQQDAVARLLAVREGAAHNGAPGNPTTTTHIRSFANEAVSELLSAVDMLTAALQQQTTENGRLVAQVASLEAELRLQRGAAPPPPPPPPPAPHTDARETLMGLSGVEVHGGGGGGGGVVSTADFTPGSAPLGGWSPALQGFHVNDVDLLSRAMLGGTVVPPPLHAKRKGKREEVGEQTGRRAFRF